MDTIGDRILRIRREYKLSQAGFGLKVGVSQAHVSDLETGKQEPPEALRIAICHRFSINESWLSTGQGETIAKNIASSNDDLVGSKKNKNLLEGGSMDLVDKFADERAKVALRDKEIEELKAELAELKAKSSKKTG